MLHPFHRAIGFLLALCLAIGGVNLAGLPAASAMAEGASVMDAPENNGSDGAGTATVDIDIDELASRNAGSLLGSMAKAADTQPGESGGASGAWRYSVDESGFATITGCDDVTATGLSVPLTVDGYAVTAIGERAFCANTGLRQLAIHGNVLTIAENAFDGLSKALTIRAYHGAYALDYAAEHGFGTKDRSVLTFMPGVVDLTDAIDGHVKATGAGEYRFSMPEAGRVKVGTVFCIPALEVACKITAIAYNGNGAAVSVVEASVEELVKEIQIDAHDLAPDWANAQWADGVAAGKFAVSGGRKASFGVEKQFADNVKVNADISLDLSVDLVMDIDIANRKIRESKATLSTTLGVEGKVTGKLPLVNIPLARLPIPVNGIATLYYEASLECSTEGSLSAKLALTGTLGAVYDRAAGEYRFENTIKPSFDVSLKGKIGLYLKSEIGVNVLFVGDVLAFGDKAGVGVEAAMKVNKPQCIDTDVFFEHKLYIKSEIFFWRAQFEKTLDRVKLFSNHYEFQNGLSEFPTKVPLCTYNDKSYNTVRFDTGGAPIDEQNVYYGECAEEPDVPVRKGYAFTGWYDKKTNALWDFTKAVFQNMELYAGWTNNYAILTLVDEQQGTVAKPVPIGAKLSGYVSSMKLLYNYVFNGWYSNAARTSAVNLTTAVMPANGMTMYAGWTYQAERNPFDGTISSNDLEFTLNADGASYAVGAVYKWIDSAIIVIPKFYNGKPVTEIRGNAFDYNTSITSVTIPNSVTSIGAYAFYGCTSLTSVTIPNSMTSIGDNAFVNCHNLTSIAIPNSVTNIGNGAFNGCTSLAEVTLPARLTRIGYIMFAGCDSLTSVTIPNSVTSIGDRAFYSCDGLTSVTIPNNVISIGDNAFESCTGLTSVTIPNGVTSIGGMAFKYCDGLMSVTIPNSVTNIGAYAFDYCTELTSVTILNSSLSLNFYTFCNCTSLNTIYGYANSTAQRYANAYNIPFVSLGAAPATTKAATTTGIYTYELLQDNTARIQSCSDTAAAALALPAALDGHTVTSIAPFAFSGCAALASVTIPETVTDIGEDAFLGLPDLALYGSVGDCVARAYARSNLLDYNVYTLTYLSRGEIANDFRAEAGYALPETYVPELGGMTFDGWFMDEACTTRVVEGALMPAENLTLYAGWICDFLVTGDAEYAITGYVGDGVDIDVPEAIDGVPVTAIAAGAFAATSASPISSLTIRACVASIASGAITGAGKIIGTAGSAAQTYAGANGISFEQITYAISFATNGARAMETMYLPEGTAFTPPTPVYDNHHLMGWYTDIDEAKWTNGAPLPARNMTFYADWQTMDGNVPDIPYAITYVGDTATIDAYEGNELYLAIPSSINGCAVTAIGDYAFADCDTLCEVTLPTTVTSIGRGAFSGSDIQAITGLDNVITIGAHAFDACYSLTALTLPAGLSKVPDAMLRDCINLASLTITNDATAIGESAFSGCERLESVTLGASVSEISARAFSGCESLTGLTLPAALVSIDPTALDGCTSLAAFAVAGGSGVYKAVGGALLTKDGKTLLRYPAASAGTSFAVPDGVTEISGGAFKSAKNLQNVSFPASVTRLGDDALSGCEQLVSVSFAPGIGVSTLPAGFAADCLRLGAVSVPASVTGILSGAFRNCGAMTEIHFVGDNVGMISGSAFDGCTSLTFYGVSGSYAESYAASHGIGFVAEQGVPIASMTMDAVLTMGAGDVHTLTTALLPANATYAGRITWAVDDAEIAAITPDASDSRRCAVSAVKKGATVVRAQASSGAFAVCLVLADQNVTRLPAAAKELAADAFAGCAIEIVLAGDGLETIGARAFANNAALKYIHLPQSVRTIAQDAFSGCGSLTILCPKNSIAYDFAVEKGISVIAW